MDRVQRIRDAYKRCDADDGSWVEGRLALAQELWAAKQDYPSTQAFSVWLVENDLYRYGHQDQAALLNIAQHPDLFRDVMATSTSRSLQLIWVEMQRRLTSASKSAPGDPAPPNPPENASSPEPSAPSAPTEPLSAVSVSAPSASRSRRSPDRDLARQRSPFRDYPQFDLWHQYVQNNNTRHTWGQLAKQKMAKPIWALLIRSIESGAYGPPTAHDAVKHPTLRLILPWAPQGYADRFNLKLVKDRAIVQERILPVVIAHRAELQQDASQLRVRVDAEYALQQQEIQRRAQAEKLAAAAAKLPSDETVVIAYGAPLWPIVGLTPQWTHAEVCHAMWFFEFTAPQFRAEATVKGRALQINQMLKWIFPAHDSGWSRAVRQIAYHYEQAPEAPCQVPPPPPNYRVG